MCSRSWTSPSSTQRRSTRSWCEWRSENCCSTPTHTCVWRGAFAHYCSSSSGKTGPCLYLAEDFEREFARSRRLRSKFPWVDEPEYRDSRQIRLQIGRKEKRAVRTAIDFIGDQADADALGVSAVDISVLGHAYVLDIGVVTDDADMRALGSTFGIEIMSTLSLLKLMLDAGHIDNARVRQITAYWRHERDLPAKFGRDYRRLFGEPPP